jgi:hypothetical protein
MKSGDCISSLGLVPDSPQLWIQSGSHRQNLHRVVASFGNSLLHLHSAAQAFRHAYINIVVLQSGTQLMTDPQALTKVGPRESKRASDSRTSLVDKFQRNSWNSFHKVKPRFPYIKGPQMAGLMIPDPPVQNMA